MKKIVLIVFVGGFVFVFCKKDYICICISINNNGEVVSISILIIMDYLFDVKVKCNEGDGLFVGYMINCEI